MRETSVEPKEQNWRTERPDDHIEFVTEEELYGVIPTPDTAHKHLPEWYKHLPLELDGGVERSDIGESTVRACIPFLEAMKQGYVLKTPCDISLTVNGDHFEYEWRMNTTEDAMTHFDQALLGDMFPSNNPILKFHSLWKMKVPDGYSILQTPLLNRRNEERFHPFSGFLDIDNYFQTMNSIVEWTGGDFDGVIEKGTPIAQFTPIKRDTLLTEATARPMTEAEETEVDKQQRTIHGEQRHYRSEMWDPVDATRVSDDQE